MLNFFIIFQRLSREAVRVLIEDIRPLLPNPRRRHAVSIELQVLNLKYYYKYIIVYFFSIEIFRFTALAH